MMNRSKGEPLSIAWLVLFVMAGSLSAHAQGNNRPVDPRMDDIKKLQEFNQITDAQQKDKAAQLTKEQRTAVVNEAFKRLQMLHNEMITMISSDEKDAKKITAVAEEVKLRASELNANLALPPLPETKDKPQKAAKETAKRATPSEYMSALCLLIRDFAKNVNLSPTDPKAGVQARRDLVALIQRSDDLLLSVSAAAKS
jgi:hypothetical protein